MWDNEISRVQVVQQLFNKPQSRFIETRKIAPPGQDDFFLESYRASHLKHYGIGNLPILTKNPLPSSTLSCSIMV